MWERDVGDGGRVTFGVGFPANREALLDVKYICPDGI